MVWNEVGLALVSCDKRRPVRSSVFDLREVSSHGRVLDNYPSRWACLLSATNVCSYIVLLHSRILGTVLSLVSRLQPTALIVRSSCISVPAQGKFARVGPCCSAQL